jgi:DnaK suppressor protein
MDTDITTPEASGRGGLTPEQLSQLRGQLLDLQAALSARLRRQEAVVREAEPEIEPLEVAEQTREQDDAVTFSQRDRELLSDVNYALRKIDDGSYGISEASGDPIPFERLRAVPWARTDSDEGD